MSAVVKAFPPRRRLNRRVPLNVPVALVHESGTVGVAVGRNLSVTGIQISCTQLTLDSLYRSDSVLSHNTPLLDLHFMLPVFRADAKVDSRCRLIYTNDTGNRGYLLGLEFSFLPESSRRHVVEFVSEYVCDS